MACVEKGDTGMGRTLAALGLIWDLKGVPKHILHSKNKEHAQELKKQYEKTEEPEHEHEPA